MALRRSTAQACADFLDTLAACGNVSEAARAVGISRSHAYVLRAENADFAAAWDAAMAEAVDALEALARRRVMDGVEQPVFYRGEVVGYTRRYSDALLMFLLRAHRPETYHRQALPRPDPAARPEAPEEETEPEVYSANDCGPDELDEGDEVIEMDGRFRRRSDLIAQDSWWAERFDAYRANMARREEEARRAGTDPPASFGPVSDTDGV